jgi:hypothetical protein
MEMRNGDRKRSRERAWCKGKAERESEEENKTRPQNLGGWESGVSATLRTNGKKIKKGSCGDMLKSGDLSDAKSI